MTEQEPLQDSLGAPVKKGKSRHCGSEKRTRISLENNGREGLLIGRRDFDHQYGRLVTGDRISCLADSLALALGVDHQAVRAGIL